MKPLLTLLLALLIPTSVSALTVPWNRSAVGTITPLYPVDTLNIASTTGTSTFAGHVEIDGNLQVTGTLSSLATIVSSGAITGTHFIATDSSATSTFAGAMTVTGYVGIGTTNPTHNLEVYESNSAATTSINITNAASATAGNAATLNFRMNSNFISPSFYSAQISNINTSANVGRLDFNLYNGLAAGGEQKMSILSTGNVGIGTTSPYRTLSIVGSGVFSGSNPRLDFAGLTNNWYLQTVDSDGRFRIGNQTGLTEPLTILTTGNTGIATSSPERTLTVAGSALIARTGSPQLVLRRDGTQDWQFSIGSTGALTILDATGSSLSPFTIEANSPDNSLYIKDTGVGMGTSSPYKKLSLSFDSSGASGTSNIPGIVLHDTSTGSSWDTSNPSSAILFSSGDASGLGGSVRGTIGHYMNEASGGQSRIGIALPLVAGGTLTERLSVLYTGNVGVGSTSPAKLFTVYSTAASGGQMRISSPGSQTFDFQRTDSTTASGNIDWLGSDLVADARLSYNSAVGDGFEFQLGGSVQGFWNTSGLSIGSTTSAGKLTLNCNSCLGGNTMSFTHTNTAINQQEIAFWEGTTKFFGFLHDASPLNPSNKFTLRVASTNTGLDTNAMTWTQSGDIGIGTTSPTSRLQVYETSQQNNETDSANAFGGANTVNLSIINADAMAQYKGGSIGFGGRQTTGTSPYLWGVIKGGKENSTNANYAGYLGFWTTESGSTASEKMHITSRGNVGIGTTTPGWDTTLHIATSTANATTTMTIGKVGQNKGSCLELFDAAGSAVYAYVQPGATSFTLSTVSCK